jgi:hypothetical protein
MGPGGTLHRFDERQLHYLDFLQDHLCAHTAPAHPETTCCRDRSTRRSRFKQFGRLPQVEQVEPLEHLSLPATSQLLSARCTFVRLAFLVYRCMLAASLSPRLVRTVAPMFRCFATVDGAP